LLQHRVDTNHWTCYM